MTACCWRGGPVYSGTPHGRLRLLPRCDCGVDVSLTAAGLEEPQERFVVEVSGQSLAVRLPTSRDLAALAGCESVEAARRMLIRRCIEGGLAGDGSPAGDGVLDGEDVAAVVEAELDRRGGISVAVPGDADAVLALDNFILNNQDHWFIREVLGMMRRTFARLDVTSRSMYAIVEPGSCFAGCLLELALAADRIYMLDAQEGNTANLTLSKINFGPLPMVNHLSRLEARFYGDREKLQAAANLIGRKLSAKKALDAGLVTSAPDDLDWEDEIRQAIESRVALSPDALTGLEANLRFGSEETMETRVLGRLSAWQNWIFVRPNAVGADGALKVYGTGAPVKFNWERT